MYSIGGSVERSPIVPHDRTGAALAPEGMSASVATTSVIGNTRIRFRIVGSASTTRRLSSIARLRDSLEPSEHRGDPAGGVALRCERGEGSTARRLTPSQLASLKGRRPDREGRVAG